MRLFEVVLNGDERRKRKANLRFANFMDKLEGGGELRIGFLILEKGQKDLA